jgi:hypothetical protein
MDIERLKSLLDSVASGDMSTEQALNALKTLPYDELGDFAQLDTHRPLRTGLPEVVYCPGKSDEQLAVIVQRLAEQSDRVLATRASPEQFKAVRDLTPSANYQTLARLITVGTSPESANQNRYVAVLTAGTADTPVAEEAALTLEFTGNRVQRCYDVGVAGLHRILSKLDLIQNAHVVIVCAGMEGALASVVAGLVNRPVIAVPTSVGYGASFGGITALLAMLNSCSGGVAVMNIDNGFGAAIYAHRINTG